MRFVVGRRRRHDAGENRRGGVQPRCAQSRFADSRADAGNPAGEAASTRTDSKTTAAGLLAATTSPTASKFAQDSRVSRRGTGSASPLRVAQPSTTYEPGDTTSTVLYGIVRDHFETCRSQAASLRDGAGLPTFVEQEFRDFLRCGCLAGGFACCRCAAVNAAPRPHAGECGRRQASEQRAGAVGGRAANVFAGGRRRGACRCR
jgi:hypothetical protein